jgi:hypothetical protein
MREHKSTNTGAKERLSLLASLPSAVEDVYRIRINVDARPRLTTTFVSSVNIEAFSKTEHAAQHDMRLQISTVSSRNGPMSWKRGLPEPEHRS